VIGQVDFQSGSINAGNGPTNCTAKSFYGPNGVCADDATIFVTDDGNVRVLGWAPAPLTSFSDANRLLGKDSYTDHSFPNGITAQHMAGDFRCAAAGGVIAVSDLTYARVLIWTPAPTVAGYPGSFALGVPNTQTLGGGTSATTLMQPRGVWTNGTRIFVADGGNNRVMLWNTFPTASGQAASMVLGQLIFTTGASASPPTASSLSEPHGVFFDGTRLFVADTKNNRVLIWNSLPTGSGQAADVVVGQSDFVSKGSGTTATTMAGPRDVLAVGNALFVADTENDRVLVFTPIPTANGASARYVLGQPDLTSGGNNPSASQRTFDMPSSLTRIGDKLFVVDQHHHRVLRFTMNLSAN